MKKALSLILAAATLVSSVTGCAARNTEPVQTSSGAAGSAAQTESGSGPVTLTFWNMFTGGDGDYMYAMIDAFMEEHPDIKVESLPMVEADYYTKLPTAISVKEAPDVAVVHSSRLADITRMEDALHPLNDYDINWEEYAPNIVDATTFDGNHLAIPLDTHPLIMYYNKTILSDAGLLKEDGTPDFESGMDNFREYLKQIKEKAPAGTIPLAATNFSNNFATWIWWILYNQQNGDFLSADGRTAAFDNEKARRVLDDMYAMTYEDQTWPEGIKSGQEQFAAGTAAIAIAGVWTVGMIEDSGVDYGIMHMPQFYDRQITWGDSHTFVIPSQKDPAKYEAAVEFAYWCSQNSFPWAQAGHIPANMKVSESEEFKSLPHRSEYVSAKEEVVFYPQNPNIISVVSAIRGQLEKMQTGQASPEDTLKGMVSDVNKALQE